MRKRLCIIGAGGHGKVVADIALKMHYDEIVFVDDEKEGACMGLPIVGKTANISFLADDKTEFVLAIGNNRARSRLAKVYSLAWATIVHPSAQIAVGVSIGEGSVVMAGAIVNAETKIGAHCIVNSGAIVEHDNRLADFVHISPGAALGGTVSVGERTHIGLGAKVRNNVTICADCVVGVGGVVVKDIVKCGTYIGVPIREL